MHKKDIGLGKCMELHTFRVLRASGFCRASGFRACALLLLPRGLCKTTLARTVQVHARSTHSHAGTRNIIVRVVREGDVRKRAQSNKKRRLGS